MRHTSSTPSTPDRVLPTSTDSPTQSPVGSDNAGPRGGEFRRYRRAMAGIYVTLAGSGVALLAASVLFGLFIPTGARAETADELRECERDLSKALERMRTEIPARLGATLQQGANPRPRPMGVVAQLVARCESAATSQTGRAIREASREIGALDVGSRQFTIQFQRDVAAHVARADAALSRARALIGQEAPSP